MLFSLRAVAAYQTGDHDGQIKLTNDRFQISQCSDQAAYRRNIAISETG